jgi:exodeoxyribonuclease VII large subunit
MGDIPFTVDLEEKAEQAGPDKAHAGTGSEAGAAVETPGKPGLSLPEAPEVWSVTRLTRQVRALLEEALPAVSVEGEISNFRAAASGHLYFNLKDDGAQIRCIMFRGAAQSLRFEPEDGMQTMVRGRITVYEVRGEYQLQVLTLEPKGVGALQVAFEQLKRKLEADGLFDLERKRELPLLPRRIGVVTSPTGAAIRDILHVLGRRFPSLPVLIHPATVQGEQAAAEIVRGIETLNRLADEQEIDVIIVGRGGGSIEDLWAFNEEPVARAIFASRVPIVSAVGHEVDFTIADFVADVRAPTPSAAAELVVPNRADLRATVRSYRRRLFQRLGGDLRLALERWTGLRARLGSPARLIEQSAQRVDDLSARLGEAGGRRVTHAGQALHQAREALAAYRPDRQNRLHRAVVRSLQGQLEPALRGYLRRQREHLEADMELLQSLSPLTVLDRGYGLALDADGRPVRSIADTRVGAEVTVRLRDGRLKTDVRAIEGEQGQPSPWQGSEDDQD